VVLITSGDDCLVDESATKRLRQDLRAGRRAPTPMIDRGEGYRQLRGNA
jgi:hypothetical protein